MIIESSFSPAGWLRGPHRQTLYPVLVRPSPALDVRFERIELPDGDFVDLAWAQPEPIDERAPLVLVLPGLGGSIESKYARGLLIQVVRRGWRGALLHFRGTSGVPNRARRSYHAGATDDPRYVLERLAERYPAARIGAVAHSLGASVLLGLLAEDGEATPVQAAATVSVPLDLGRCADRLQLGFSKVYDRYLLGLLKDHYRLRVRTKDLGLTVDLRRLDSVRAFDDHITAPLHGFSGADDYYRRCSARPRLREIQRPTLIVQSLDDPFLAPSEPPMENELSEAITFEVSRWGGHVGFVDGGPKNPGFWLETRLLEFLKPYLAPLVPR